MIFDAQQLNSFWTVGEVPGTRYGLSKSGWTDSELFQGWLKEHFVTHAVRGRPVLLLVDGHTSHFDPSTIKFAKERIFCLPPHTTHEVQPLDVSFFGPLKNQWSRVCHEFYQASPGRIVTKFNFNQLFSKAWMKAATSENVTSGFRRAGVIPFNPDAVLVTSTISETPPSSSNSSSLTTEDCSDTPESGAVNDKENDATVSSPPPTFTAEQIALFERRYEEGYNLYDPKYNEWLHFFHPEAEVSLADSFSSVTPLAEVPMEQELQSTPPHISTPLQQSVPLGNSSTEPLPSCRNSPMPLSQSTPLSNSSTLLQQSSSTPPSYSSTPLRPSPHLSSSTGPEKEQSPPQGKNVSLSCDKTSAVTKHLRPLSELQPKVPPKTGAARVLTSAECLAALEEKRRKKEAEIEQKEKNKQERLRKKQEREEVAKKKKAENEAKKRERQEAARLKKEELEKKRAERERRKQENASKKAKQSTSTTKVSTRSGLISAAAPASLDTVSLTSGSSESSTITATSSDVPMDGSQGDSSECTFCYGLYDADDGRDWVRCACGQWVHEGCLEDIFIDVNGLERFCPYCLNM